MWIGVFLLRHSIDKVSNDSPLLREEGFICLVLIGNSQKPCVARRHHNRGARNGAGKAHSQERAPVVWWERRAEVPFQPRSLPLRKDPPRTMLSRPVCGPARLSTVSIIRCAWWRSQHYSHTLPKAFRTPAPMVGPTCTADAPGPHARAVRRWCCLPDTGSIVVAPLPEPESGFQ